MGTDAENCPACQAGKLCLKHGEGVYLSGPDGHTKASGTEADSSDLGAVLDPDQIKCRRCFAAPGKPCVTPTGARAQVIHKVRKRDARPDEPQTPSPHGRGFTSEQASAAAKSAAQSRRRRKAETEARAEEIRVQLEREKLEAEATRLARDASRYADQRAKLKALVLDVAVAAFDATHEALTHQRRIVMDDEGRPIKVTKEIIMLDEDGNGVRELVEVPDERGYATAKDAASLMAAAAASLDKVRLEEDKPTGIHRNQTVDATDAALAEQLGKEGVDRLIEAARLLDPPPNGATP
jgi:hypothetical protein